MTNKSERYFTATEEINYNIKQHRINCNIISKTRPALGKINRNKALAPDRIIVDMFSAYARSGEMAIKPA